MTFRERMLHRPHSLWLRRALFQVHLWTGVALGLYIFAISVSGSAIVFRREITRLVARGPVLVRATGPRLTPEQLGRIAQDAYPGYRVSRVWTARRSDVAVDVWLEKRTSHKQRLFDPYTGKDLGDTVPTGLRVLDWVVDFHDNLLADQRGRFVNGIGALSLMVLCLTGMVVWWPGVAAWRRHLVVRWRVNWKRFNWDLHNFVGFWTAFIVFMWALTALYLVFPQSFSWIVDTITPPDNTSLTPRAGDIALEWIAKLHFGRFAGWKTKTLWVVLGLTPPFLFVTGVIMWSTRVLRRGSEQALVANRPRARSA